MYMLSCLLHLHMDRSWQLGHRIKSKFDKMFLLCYDLQIETVLCLQHFNACILGNFSTSKINILTFSKGTSISNDSFKFDKFWKIVLEFECLRN